MSASARRPIWRVAPRRLSAAFLVTLLGVACARTASPPGELVLVVSSDMSIPKDIDTLRVQVLSGGQVANDASYPLGPDGLLLPATLGILAGRTPSVPATIRVIGISQHKAVVLREAVVQVPTDRTATLRMPLEWSCLGSASDPSPSNAATDIITSTCAQGETCIEGGCASDSVDGSTLPIYDGNQVIPASGDAPTCFDTLRCFADATPAMVDLTSCSIGLPGGVDPAQVNLALQPADGAGICAGTRCFVPIDRGAGDGWTLSGLVAVLPSALCNALQSDLQATVQISTACPSKTASLPTCGSWSRGGMGSGADGGAEGGSLGGIDGSADAGSADARGSIDATPSEASASDAAGHCGTCGADQTCVGSTCVPTVTTTATSCQGSGPGLSNCGPSGSDSCCASLAVPAASAAPSCSSGPVNVSGVRLDKYEVTVGRFRQFLTATNGGWLPLAGSGKHDHVNGGQGLANADASDGGPPYETGWDTSWNSSLTASLDAWSTYASNGSWTSAPGTNENLPMLGLTWYEAYAFCIWDGGFLPSTSEWQVAASGGEGRTYPWSSPAASTTIDCSYADYFGGPGGTSCVPTGGDTVNICEGNGCQPKPTNPSNVGSESPKGDGKWGHADLAGNAVEWNLDAWGTLSACTDCANLGVGATQRNQGGGFFDPAAGLVVSSCSGAPPSTNGMELGVRCARTP